jgi:glutathione S-transferase
MSTSGWHRRRAGVPGFARVIGRWGARDHDQALATSHQLLGVMNAHLESRSWLVGNGPTLADVACYSYLAVADEGGVELAEYPNVQTWLRRVEGLDGFVPMPKLPKR